MLWVALTLSPGWVYPPLILLLAGRFHALGVVLHDAAHMPLRGKTAAIRLVEILCGYPIATTLNAMRYHHLRHHRDNGMATDPYYKSGSQTAGRRILYTLRGLALVPFWTVRALIGAVACLCPSVRHPYAHIFLQERVPGELHRSSEVIECAFAECGQLAFQCVLIAMVIAFPEPAWWGYVLPVSIAALFAARRVLIEHTSARAADRRVETIFTTTKDNHLGWLGAMVLAPRNIGYHVVHHIHPQVGLSALPRLRQWYVERHPGLYP